MERCVVHSTLCEYQILRQQQHDWCRPDSDETGSRTMRGPGVNGLSHVSDIIYVYEVQL